MRVLLLVAALPLLQSFTLSPLRPTTPLHPLSTPSPLSPPLLSQPLHISLDEPLFATLTPYSPPPSYFTVPALLLSSVKLAIAYVVFTTTVNAVGAVVGKADAVTRADDPANAATSLTSAASGAVTSLNTLASKCVTCLLSTLSKLALISPRLLHLTRLAYGRVRRFNDWRLAGRPSTAPTYKFTGDEWGVATLAHKTPVPGSNYIKYGFKLPKEEGKSTLPIRLSQQMVLCCLDRGKNVVKSDFFLASPREEVGGFEIVGVRGGRTTMMQIGEGGERFHRVMEEELNVGDEVAIKPGNSNLEYRGEHLPITDMVLVCSGLGVVPMINQVKEVLRSRKSTVKTVSVVWINEKAEEFTVAYDELEREFYKYNKKLEVSCCLEEDLYSGVLGDNEEFSSSLPNFTDGTMAVVAGPDYFIKKATQYLVQRGYKSDCVCALPSQTV